MVATSAQKNKSSEFISDFVDKGCDRSFIDNGNVCIHFFSLHVNAFAASLLFPIEQGWCRSAVVHVYSAVDAELQGRRLVAVTSPTRWSHALLGSTAPFVSLSVHHAISCRHKCQLSERSTIKLNGCLLYPHIIELFHYICHSHCLGRKKRLYCEHRDIICSKCALISWLEITSRKGMMNNGLVHVLKCMPFTNRP